MVGKYENKQQMWWLEQKAKAQILTQGALEDCVLGRVQGLGISNVTLSDMPPPAGPHLPSLFTQHQ